MSAMFQLEVNRRRKLVKEPCCSRSYFYSKVIGSWQGTSNLTEIFKIIGIKYIAALYKFRRQRIRRKAGNSKTLYNSQHHCVMRSNKLGSGFHGFATGSHLIVCLHRHCNWSK